MSTTTRATQADAVKACGYLPMLAPEMGLEAFGDFMKVLGRALNLKNYDLVCRLIIEAMKARGLVL